MGDKIEDCYKKMWVPYLEDIRNRWPEYDVHCEGACSSCQALLTLNMETLKAIGIYDENKGMTVVAGCDNKLDPSIPDKQMCIRDSPHSVPRAAAGRLGAIRVRKRRISSGASFAYSTP